MHLCGTEDVGGAPDFQCNEFFVSFSWRFAFYLAVSLYGFFVVFKVGVKIILFSDKVIRNVTRCQCCWIYLL